MKAGSFPGCPPVRSVWYDVGLVPLAGQDLDAESGTVENRCMLAAVEQRRTHQVVYDCSETTFSSRRGWLVSSSRMSACGTASPRSSRRQRSGGLACPAIVS